MHAGAAATMTRARSDVAALHEAMDDPEKLLGILDEQGVERAALINYTAPEVMGFTASVNEWVSDFVRGHADRLIAVGSVHPRETPGAAARTAQLVEQLGIRMLKIHPPHQLFAANEYREGSEALRQIYATAERSGLPVMIHTGTSVFPGARNRFADPMAVDDVAIDFPNLPILLAHAGRPLFMPTAMFLARRHPNVYLELSGIPPKKLLEYLPRLEELADKCVWGTDWPSPGVTSMKKNVEDFLSLPISDEAKRKILWDNGASLIAG
jgi:predicted TIM-barrel fold metal-dependent hydrolase